MNIPIHRRFDAGMTEQFLQHFWLHPAFNRPRGVGVAQRVHTKAPNSCFVAEFVEMGVIGTVFCRFPGTPVDKNKITHTQARSFSRAPIHVFQRGVEQFRFLLLRNLRIELFQDVVRFFPEQRSVFAVSRHTISCNLASKSANISRIPFALPRRGKKNIYKKESGCLRPFPRTSALAFHCHSIIIFA